MITALRMTNELLEILPDHERAQGNKMYYEKHLETTTLPKPDLKLMGDDGSAGLDSITAVCTIFLVSVFILNIYIV